MKDISIYVHIPFCKAKCYYCDFLSFPEREVYFDEYKNALINEISEFELPKDYIVKTIFFGGGTPSVFPPFYMEEVCEALYKRFNISENVEFSIEANPKTVDRQKLNVYKKIGINRISMGLQAFQDLHLKRIGRIHTSKDFLKSYQLLRESGFKNINIDIMFALPLMTISEFEETVLKVAELKPEHISAYSLIVEEGTPMFNMYEKNKDWFVSDEDDRQMYYLAKRIFLENGYKHYEISNFAKKGFECEHNKVYWKRKEYLGFGASAHSFYNEQRFSNTSDFFKYISGRNVREYEDITLHDRYAEFMFLGLRMLDGIKKEDFANTFGRDIFDIFGKEINKLEKQGLILCTDGVIRLSERGIDLSNQVFVEFL